EPAAVATLEEILIIFLPVGVPASLTEFSEAKEELGFLFVQPEHGSHFCRHVPAQGSLSDGHVQQITRIADPGFASEFPIGIVGAFGLESLKGGLQKRPKVIILIDV